MNAWSPDRGRSVESHIRSRPGVLGYRSRAEVTTRATGNTVGSGGISYQRREDESEGVRRRLRIARSRGR